MKKLFFYCCALLLGACQSQGLKPSKPADGQIEAIISNMSLEEKAGQLNLIAIEGEPTAEHLEMIRKGLVGSVIKSNGVKDNSRLQKIAVEESVNGIPILFQEDVIHGYKTIAPIPLAEAASWDLEAIKTSAQVAAREAAAAGIHLTYAPMVDISRDPRWGRILEAAGEDPYLGSLVAAARVEGFQEAGRANQENILSCVKHFAGYGASLAGMDYNIDDFSERALREVHLPPFQAAIDAGVSSVMCAYTAYDGVPLTANQYLLQEVLREEMGFDGLVMTDWQTIPNLVKIGVAPNDTIATEMAMAAGVDMDMVAEKYVSLLPELVRSGKIAERDLDQAVGRVLRLKKDIGLLDQPMRGLNPEKEKQELLSEENWKLTKDIALKSMVLLKNESEVLPISTDTKKIAVIGPFANVQEDLMGWWSGKGEAKDVVSILEGIKQAYPKSEITFAAGCKIDKFEKAGAEMIAEAVQVAKRAEVVVLVLGEQYWMSGEGGGTASLHLPGLQEALVDRIAELNKPTVSVIVSGRPYILTEIAAKSDAVLQAWMPGTTGGEAVGEILSGAFNPSGRLPVTFPSHEGQVPIFYSYRKTSHDFEPEDPENRYSTTYRDISNKPLYPFGYGLSYTDFEYGSIKVDQPQMSWEQDLQVVVTVKNSGSRAGVETVQLYIRRKYCEVTQPLLLLKDFQQVKLEAGEQREVKFNLSADKLSFIDQKHQTKWADGAYEVYVGPNAAELQKAAFTFKNSGNKALSL
ncbi:beta-glucosidase BglX [Persicobacter diffluens]|uniref:Glycosyl hydrolase n=1 Tax=Persicobacter diffluens TaxID=981 RepID=A0AAN4W504_9BACT|nr:glycosyl hydrolase [Persicobacter diffluens]